MPAVGERTGCGSSPASIARALTTAAAFVALLVVASVLSTILAVRATRAERQATADRNRALVAEAKATEERDRSLTAEAAARKAAAKAEAVSKFLLTDMLTEMAPGGILGRTATVEQLLDNATVRRRAGLLRTARVGRGDPRQDRFDLWGPWPV